MCVWERESEWERWIERERERERQKVWEWEREWEQERERERETKNSVHRSWNPIRAMFDFSRYPQNAMWCSRDSGWFLYMCACVVNIFTCIRVRVSVCVYVVFLGLRLFLYLCACGVYMYTCLRACVRVCACVCVYGLIYKNICILCM